MGFRERIKLVTFDATNTLLRFREPPWEYYANTARQHGFKGTEATVQQQLLGSMRAMANKHPNFGKYSISWVEWWREVVRLTFQGQLPASADIKCIASTLIDDFKTSKCWTTADGGDKLVRLFQSYGISIGIISNFDPRLNDILKNLNMYEVFDFVLTSYEVGYSKPDKRIFEHALSVTDRRLCPSQCLHIGDDARKDYWGARGAGWHALLINKTSAEKPPAPDHVFNNLLELSIALESDRIKF